MKKLLALVCLGIVFIPLSSVVPTQIADLWFNQYIALLFGLFLAISFFVYRFDKALSLFLASCLFSTFFVASLAPRAIILLTQVSLGSLAAYGISKFNQSQRRLILYSFLTIFALQYILMIAQTLNVDPFFDSLSNKNRDFAVGFSGSPGQMGAFFAILTPVLLYLSPVLVIGSLYGVMISKSSFSMVALALSSLVYLSVIYRSRLKIIIPIVLLSLVLFFAGFEKITSGDIQTRSLAWKSAVSHTVSGKLILKRNDKVTLLKKNPLFGYGFGSFLTYFPFVPTDKFNFVDEKFTHAHNDAIELFFETGWVGISTFFLLIFGFFSSFIRSKKGKELTMYFCCILAYLLNSMGIFVSHIAVNGLFLIVLYGCYKGTLKEDNGKTASLV